MRIAIAGTGGLAALLAQELSKSAHTVVVLSRVHHPEFEGNYDCQAAVVDYHNLETLRYFLQGVDLVISTITGISQLNLIDAARRARVHTFVPSEFEGPLSQRPAPENDPFDSCSSAALQQLQQWSTSKYYRMNYTVFSCGVFYEHFAPGGLRSYNMGATCRLPNQGDFLVNIALGAAELPASDAQGRQIHLALTSAHDVARFVAAAVELGIDRWPREFKMCGAYVTPQRIVQHCIEVRRIQFNVINRSYADMVAWLDYYHQNNDEERWLNMQHLVQTANGRYTMDHADLNELVGIETMDFRKWLDDIWGPAH